MELEDHERDIASSLVATPWTVEKCVDIRRSLSTRVNNARKHGGFSKWELHDMATLYMAVHGIESTIRDRQELDPAAPWPEWVLRGRF